MRKKTEGPNDNQKTRIFGQNIYTNQRLLTNFSMFIKFLHINLKKSKDFQNKNSIEFTII